MSGVFSGSEVDQYFSCKRKHYYAFGEPMADGSRGMQAKTHSDSLRKGTLGHLFLSNYYDSIMAGHPVTSSEEYAISVGIVNLDPADTGGAQIFADTAAIFRNYISRYGETDLKEWEPLAIEKEFRLEVGVNNTLAFKPDGIFREKATGKIYIWDHKFLYNFYQDRTLPIMPQMTRYAAALRHLGYQIHGAMYNMLSTRPNVKTKPFERLVKPLNGAAMDRFWNEMIIASQEIRDIKAGDPVAWKDNAPRTASDFNCKNCPFLDVCIADLEDRPGRHLMVKTFYEPNSYGYSENKEKTA